jgi:hypothetical protein
VFRDVQEAVVIQRASAADVTARHEHLPSGRFDGLYAGDTDIGVQVVVEGVGEQDDPRSAGVDHRPPEEPLLQRRRCERRQRRLPLDPGDEFGEAREHRRLGSEVRQLGNLGGQPSGLIDEAERVGIARPPPAQ